MTRGSAAWLLAIPIALAAAIYARFFGGYWLGDDFGNLRSAWLTAERGELASRAWAQLFAAAPSEAAFYRPAMIASLLGNEWLAGLRFAGWFAVNYAVHLLNVALVGLLVARLAAAMGRDGRVAGAIAAAFFALCPLVAEGVFWISARADASVALLTLAGVFWWSRAPASTAGALALPLCLLLALGFKESAAVFPLQMALVALAWPLRLSRAQVVAITACFVLTGLFFAIRAHLFGDVWQVYRTGGTASPAESFRDAIGSIGAWWRGLTRQTPTAATLYALVASLAAALVLLAARGMHRRLALALMAGAAGLWVATLLNLGGMKASGEGGRLAYLPVAWLALALGVAGAAPAAGGEAREAPSLRRTGLALLAVATLAGAWVLEHELRLAGVAQRDMRALTQAVRDWTVTHPGLTLLVLDGEAGPVATARNAHGGLVMPPIQPEPMLHRVLPTLWFELELRHHQLAAGLATRLDAMRPSRIDADVLKRLAEPAAPRWPEHYGCWSPREHRIIAFAAPDPVDRARWATAVRAGARACAPGG